MTAKPMTRRKALKIAQCIQSTRNQIPWAIYTSPGADPAEMWAYDAKLAAALAWLEQQARQKEMHL